MSKSIIESFEWVTSDMKQLGHPSLSKARIKIVAARAGQVSRNGRKYVADELKKSSRSWDGKPITINHAPTSPEEAKAQSEALGKHVAFDPTKIVGNIEYGDYSNESETLEMIGVVNKEPYVSMIKNHDPKLRGVSIEAKYSKTACPKCGLQFESEEAWNNHMKNVEFIKNFSIAEPHGLRGAALSIVVAPEVPGVEGANFQLFETLQQAGGFERLCESIINDKMEYSNLKPKLEPTITVTPTGVITSTGGITASGTGGEVKQDLKESKPEEPAIKEKDPEPKLEIKVQEQTKICPECGKPLNQDGECMNEECSQFQGASQVQEKLGEKHARELKELEVKQATEKQETRLKAIEAKIKTQASRLSEYEKKTQEALEASKQIPSIMEKAASKEDLGKLKEFEARLDASKPAFEEWVKTTINTAIEGLQAKITSMDTLLGESRKNWDDGQKQFTEHVKNINEAYSKLKTETEAKTTEIAEKKVKETASLQGQISKVEDKLDDLKTHIKPEFKAPLNVVEQKPSSDGNNPYKN